MKRIILLLTALSFWTGTAQAQWISQDAGFTAGRKLGFYEISIVDKNIVWAICFDGVNGLLGPVHVLDFTRTTNGGNTWMPGTMGNDSSLAFSNICALSGTEAWVAMHKFNLSKGGGLFHTTDGGATWNQPAPGAVFDTNSFPNFVHFKNPLEGVAGGDTNGGYFEIHTTVDGGNSWTRTPQANIPAFTAGQGGGWFDGYCALGNTLWFGTDGGQIYKSVDFGQNWSLHTVSPQGYTVYEIAFNDDGQHGLTHVRSSSATFLFATSDGGVTWTQMPTHPKWKQSKLTAVPGTSKFVSTSVIGFNQGSAYTTDLGATWIEIESASMKAACRFLDSTTGWAGGFFNDNPPQPFSGGMYKWDSSAALSVAGPGLEPDDAFIISPNPASETITVAYKTGGILKISDMRGTIILTKEFSGSAGRINIPVDSLPAGIYGYQFQGSEGAVRSGNLVISR
jgi:photosystem II stability/assembly factor-like uncharacterized protein